MSPGSSLTCFSADRRTRRENASLLVERRSNPLSIWGHLEQRFGTERPRKLLALDGGGIRGVLSLEILAEIERTIAAKTGVTRLGDYFDYIGGTSTGAIIAAGLSIGM